MSLSSGRVLTLFDLVEPYGTERGCSWSFVPFRGKKPCLGPSRIFGIASLISISFLRMPRHNNSVLVRYKGPPSSTVMSTSIKQGYICVRSVGPFGPPKEKAVQHMFSLFLAKCFSRAVLEHVRCREPVSTNSSGKEYSIRFVPMLFGGG